MTNKYNQVADLLKETAKQVNLILAEPEDELHRLKLTTMLEKASGYITLVTGSGDLSIGGTAILGPAKTIGGKLISKIPKFTEADLKPSDDQVFNLKQQVETHWPLFLEKSNESILATMDDLLIRGIAKKAGIKVTKDDPKTITVEFIQQVKEAIGGPAKETGEGDQPAAEVEKQDGVEPEVNQELITVQNELEAAQADYDAKKLSLESAEAAYVVASKAEKKKLEPALNKAKADTAAAAENVMQLEIKLEELQNANNN